MSGQYSHEDPLHGAVMQEREWRERGLREAVLTGDERAWRTWYEAEYTPLESFVLWRCGSGRDLADDVLQETWMTAVRGLRRFRPELASFHDWLCGIAAQVLRNQLRSRRRREARRLPIAVDVGRIDSTIADREQAERIAQALDGLPERYEKVLRLKYVQGMSVTAIAASTGETEKAVESLLSRARAAFREVYGDD